jgi:hypothetical protein
MMATIYWAGLCVSFGMLFSFAVAAYHWPRKGGDDGRE